MPNLNDFSRLYRRTVKGVSDGSTTVRLSLDRVDPHRLRVITHVTVENKTTAFTKCRLGINGASRDLYLDELTTIAADELAVSRTKIQLGEGDILFAELTGTTSGDAMVMTCIGWEVDL